MANGDLAPERAVYEDFEIQLAEKDGGLIEIQVLESPWGRVGDKFELPFPKTEIESRIAAVERQVAASSRRAAEDDSVGTFSLREFGTQLFDALIPPGGVRTAFDACRGRISLTKGAGLRLRITFPPMHISGPLVALPWELMCYEDRFLGRAVKFPIVRTIVARGPASPLAVEGRLRVLVVESAPKKYKRLDAGCEIREIGEALAKLKREGLVEVEVLRGANRFTLRDRLQRSEFHVLHYIGHAQFGTTDNPEGCLLFEDKQQGCAPLWGEILGDLLQGFESLRLVVLNSCSTGAFPRRDGSSPLGGVAAAIAARGMQAVVAMQFPISDEAAILFSRSFYRYLARGHSVETAVADAREVLWLNNDQSYEWVNPVTFLRGTAGRIFEIGPPNKTLRSGAPTALTARGKRTPPVRLGFISFGPDPWGEVRENSEHVLNLCEFFDERFIRHPDLWNAEIFPLIREFLKAHVPRGGRPVTLDFAAHLSVAYAVGTCLEVKSGLDVTVIQRGQAAKTGEKWSTTSKAEPIPFSAASLFVGEPERVLDPDRADTALAVGISNPVFEDVEVYLERAQVGVGRILPATLAPEPSQTGVRDGSHAFELAHQIGRIIRGRSYREREATLHLFISSPNALVFYLGQLAGTFGDVQVYEHAFRDPTRLLKYEPSIRLPPPA